MNVPTAPRRRSVQPRGRGRVRRAAQTKFSSGTSKRSTGAAALDDDAEDARKPLVVATQHSSQGGRASNGRVVKPSPPELAGEGDDGEGPAAPKRPSRSRYQEIPKLEGSPKTDRLPESERARPRTSATQVKAIAARISAARQLARKLSQEKAAVAALGSEESSASADLQRRQQQLGQVRTRTAEARADAAAQATAFKSSTRGQEAARLAAENKALLEVLSQATDGNPELQERLSSIRSRYATSGLAESHEALQEAQEEWRASRDSSSDRSSSDEAPVDTSGPVAAREELSSDDAEGSHEERDAERPVASSAAPPREREASSDSGSEAGAPRRPPLVNAVKGALGALRLPKVPAVGDRERRAGPPGPAAPPVAAGPAAPPGPARAPPSEEASSSEEDVEETGEPVAEASSEPDPPRPSGGIRGFDSTLGGAASSSGRGLAEDDEDADAKEAPASSNGATPGASRLAEAPGGRAVAPADEEAAEAAAAEEGASDESDEAEDAAVAATTADAEDAEPEEDEARDAAADTAPPREDLGNMTSAAAGPRRPPPPPPQRERPKVSAPKSKPPPVPTSPVRSRDPRAAPPVPAAAAVPPPSAAPPRPGGGSTRATERTDGFPTPGGVPTATPTPAAPKPPARKQPTLADLVAHAKKREQKFFTDYAPKPGAQLRIFFDKTKTNFAHDDNEHHMELKIGINNWAEIRNADVKLLLDVPNERDIYFAHVDLPEELFRVDFVIEDYRQGKVDNNEGKDYQLQLVDAPTEQELQERRAAAFRAAEASRLTEIEGAEAEIRQRTAEEVAAVEKEAMRAWWQRRREELRDEARREVERQLDGAGGHTAIKIEGVMGWVGGRPAAGEAATLLYNRDASELRHKKDLVVHIGVNGWDGDTTEVAMAKDDRGAAAAEALGEGDWYAAKVGVPKRATIVDFVISDTNKQVWDNNHGGDFHTPVATQIDREALEDEIYKQRLKRSLEDDSEAATLSAKKAAERIKLREAAAEKRRTLQRRSLYTSPLQPRAGEDVAILYNPNATNLAGRPDIYVRGGWNRWSHAERVESTRMNPTAPGVPWLKATVRVPEDALMLDLVFCDGTDINAAEHDNNNGFDYHVPVTGATGALPTLKVAHVSVEMAPIAKVGGMGDVVTALGRAVKDAGHDVEVVMPKYDCLKYDAITDISEQASFHFGGAHVRVFRGHVEGLRVIFLEPDNGYFSVGCVYGRNDDAHRFAFFCGAALEYLRSAPGGEPDIVHCHDWPTAPVAFGNTGRSRPVFTIHNLNYGAELIGQAMAASAVATTVSPTYAKEISGHPAVSAHLGKMIGVRNGIDMDIWDPSIDRFLPLNYSLANFDEGKAAAKRALRQRMNLCQSDAPIIGVVTRLTHQKGIHLIKHAAWRTVERGGQFVLLGSAPDPSVQNDFAALADQLSHQHNENARLCFAFDEPLSHLIYAGCDLMLVPSMFEPCGLTQMIGMRYGTVPVVRKTGGLADTVFDIDHDMPRAEEYGMQVNGFNFEGTDSGGLDYAMNRAIDTFHNDRAFFRTIALRCMAADWSWNAPANDYIELYYKALK